MKRLLASLLSLSLATPALGAGGSRTAPARTGPGSPVEGAYAALQALVGPSDPAAPLALPPALELAQLGGANVPDLQAAAPAAHAPLALPAAEVAIPAAERE